MLDRFYKLVSFSKFMLVKIHEAYRLTIAICDSDLIGKVLEEGKLNLDLTGNFFKGEEKTEEEVAAIIEDGKLEDATFSLVGKETCNLALKLGLILGSGITYIQGVPVSLVLM
jgi:uncharacterized protein